MANEKMSSSFMAMTTLGILREALKILKNAKLMHSIFFLVLIYTSLLFLAEKFALKTLINVSSISQHAELLVAIKKDIPTLVVESVISIFASFAVSFLSMLATVYASAVIYSGKQLTLKELLSKIRRIWKMPMITKLYVWLFNIVYTALNSCLILLMVITKGSMVLQVLNSVLALLVSFSYPFLTLFCMLSLVISVLEKGCYGIKAFKKARELIEGKKLQGFILCLVSVLVALPGLAILVLIAPDRSRARLIRMAIELVMVNMTCLVQIYMYIVYTLFYYECKKKHGEKVEIDMGNLVFTTPLLADASLP